MKILKSIIIATITMIMMLILANIINYAFNVLVATFPLVAFGLIICLIVAAIVYASYFVYNGWYK